MAPSGLRLDELRASHIDMIEARKSAATQNKALRTLRRIISMARGDGSHQQAHQYPAQTREEQGCSDRPEIEGRVVTGLKNSAHPNLDAGLRPIEIVHLMVGTSILKKGGSEFGFQRPGPENEPSR
jgi:hypothetical protein